MPPLSPLPIPAALLRYSPSPPPSGFYDGQERARMVANMIFRSE
jgi:hypothetical protein